MKTFTTLTIFLVLSFSSFSQTYKIYTAKKNGNWSDASVWNNGARADGIAKNKYIIPAAYTVTADRPYDYNALGNIEVQVKGVLLLANNTSFSLTTNSRIDVEDNGSIETSGISIIMIGNSLKFLSFFPRVLDGPVYTDFVTTAFASLYTLSVDLISFTGARSDHDVNLKWSTANEMNNSHFDVEYSLNGRDWSKIGTVKSANQANAVQQYAYIHKDVSASTLSYRLKQVDVDGSFDYSKVVVMKQDAGAIANVFSHNKKVSINFNSEVKSAVTVKILNMNGNIVASQFLNRPSSSVSLNVSQLKTGFYIVQVSDNSNPALVQQIVIN